MKNRRNRLFSNGLFYILVFVVLLAGINWAMGGSGSGSSSENIRYSEFLKDLKAGKVKSFNIQPANGVYTVTGTFKKAQTAKNQNNNTFSLLGGSSSKGKVTNFSTTMLQDNSMVSEVSKAAQQNGTAISGQGESQSGTWISTLVMLVPTIIFIVMLWMMMNQTGGGGRGRGMMSFGKTQIKPQDPSKNKVRFSDVAGEEEEKQELVEIVEFLKNPSKFTKLGARIPAGVLLEGPPGTGKTLLARAVAGEAGVPFYSISGSDFVEMFVGVGASRVRDLFETAKKNAPSIIFIDEIDAVGRKRGNGMNGGHDEREQTLNQLLVEMDGFDGDEGVIVIAATNRSDVLDPALLRPGRFDRKVLVGRPDVKGREAILRVHARNKPLASNVDLKEIARQTPGFVGADLENLLNEAALVAARRDNKQITAADIDEAEDRVIAGPAKKDTVISAADRKRVAYHEAGHAIVGLVLSDSRTVRKVTIVPRGRAGGYNIMLPKEDQNLLTKKQLMEQIAGFMGGRAGEEIAVGEKSTGASNDIEQATNIARGMVTQYGMTDVGMAELESPSMQSPYGTKPYSEATAAKIDDTVEALLNQGYETAKEIINNNREIHHAIAEALLKYETLNEKQILSLYKTGKMPEDSESEFPSENTPTTFEQAKAAAEKQTLREEKIQEEDDKKNIHPLPDDDRNINDIPLNPPSEKSSTPDAKHEESEKKDESDKTDDQK